MKKIVSIVLFVLILTAAGFAVKYQMDLPLDIDTYTVSSGDAMEYFIEEGYIKDNTRVEVFGKLPGQLISVNVSEGDMIQEGEIICQVDSSEYDYGIMQAESDINSYAAQQQNLDLEEQRRRTDLEASKNSLKSEYETIVAQQNDYINQRNDALAKESDAIAKENEAIDKGNDIIAKENEANISKSEQTKLQIRLQEILIEQNKSDLATAKKNAETAQILFDNNAITKSAYDTAIETVDGLQTKLDASLRELEILKAGDIPPLIQPTTKPSVQTETQAYTQYYESMKQSIEAKIADINASLGKSYTAAMKEYYQALIEAQKVNVTKLNEKIEDCTLRAPVSGKITKLNIKDTNMLNVQAPAAIITTDKSTEIEVYVPTKNYGNIRLGDYVEITQVQDSGDIVFGGTVKEIDDEAVAKLSTLGVEERKIKVIIEPDGTNAAALFAGFSFDVKFITYKAENQITVPKTAVFKYNDGTSDRDMVWLVAFGKAQMCEVTLGRELRTDYVIENGLLAGDIVIRDASAEGVQKGALIKAG